MDPLRQELDHIRQRFAVPGPRAELFACIEEVVRRKNAAPPESAARAFWQQAQDDLYLLVEERLQNNPGPPRRPLSFGTSGWRGILGEDIFCRSVAQVTWAIAGMYQDIPRLDPGLRQALGVASLGEAQRRGCIVAHDNRFGGPLLARTVTAVLSGAGFTVYDAGEATTGSLSAALIETGAAFSINLTPSHNPLEYGGFKYNAADAGPAATVITTEITRRARRIIDANTSPPCQADPGRIRPLDALGLWQRLVRRNRDRHGLDYDAIIGHFLQRDDVVLAVDCVHGSSRIHLQRLFQERFPDRLILLRHTADPTFGGIAPEPSSANLAGVLAALAGRPEPLKIGAIIDPDADRIRFTDGQREIGMNQFGAMAYHYLHTEKGKRGLVAKTVATSNLANAIAERLGEEVFEPPVGFKEFKPVVGKALVCFEESDGISVIGHTPEKDAYIGLLLALDMVMGRNQGLGDYLAAIEEEFGRFYPARGGAAVRQTGSGLRAALARVLDPLQPGTRLQVGTTDKVIARCLTIDGHKIVFEDGGWLMIRPSGTEPKVRFYVEGRSEEDRQALLAAAQRLLAQCGVLAEE